MEHFNNPVFIQFSRNIFMRKIHNFENPIDLLSNVVTKQTIANSNQR